MLGLAEACHSHSLPTEAEYRQIQVWISHPAHHCLPVLDCSGLFWKEEEVEGGVRLLPAPAAPMKLRSAALLRCFPLCSWQNFKRHPTGRAVEKQPSPVMLVGGEKWCSPTGGEFGFIWWSHTLVYPLNQQSHFQEPTTETCGRNRKHS